MKKIILASLLTLNISALEYNLSDEPFNFEQIKKDSKEIWDYQNKNSIDFDWNKPSHQYFFWINIADMASTVYALENRDSLYEGNFLLDDSPEIEELLLQKVVVSYVFHQYGLFSGEEVTDDWLHLLNILLTGAVLNNYILVQKHD